MNSTFEHPVEIETFEYQNVNSTRITSFTNLKHCKVCGGVRFCNTDNICKKCKNKLNRRK